MSCLEFTNSGTEMGVLMYNEYGILSTAPIGTVEYQAHWQVHIDFDNGSHFASTDLAHIHGGKRHAQWYRASGPWESKSRTPFLSVTSQDRPYPLPPDTSIILEEAYQDSWPLGPSCSWLALIAANSDYSEPGTTQLTIAPWIPYEFSVL